MTRQVLLLLLAGPACVADAAAAQTLPARVPETGAPLPLRISLPAGWSRTAGDGTLSLTGDDGATVTLSTLDAFAGVDVATLPVPEAEARRRLTAQSMGSDSALYGVVERVAARSREGIVPGSMTRGIGTLAGERAAHVRMRMGRGGETMDFATWLTARDGVVYILQMGAPPALAARYAPLFEQIRASLVLAPVPAA